MNPGEGFESLREGMVVEQLLGRDIRDKKVLNVFRNVPRHRFVEPALQKDAYGDFPLSIGQGQTISQPYIVALMVQLLDIKADDKILEIGTGSGYETAILAELGERVFSIELIDAIADRAKRLLQELGYKNIQIKIDDGTLGWEEFAPFDKIIVTASPPEVPKPLINQLGEGGRMVIPVGSRVAQRLVLLEKVKEKVLEKEACSCVFVPLIGEYGWRDL